MARLIQASSALADSQKLTFSFWIMVPSAGSADNDRYRLFEFGGSGQDKRRSYIDLVLGASANVFLETMLVGPVITNDIWFGGPSLTPTNCPHYMFSNTVSLTRGTFLDHWHHIGLSLDLTVGGFESFPQSQGNASYYWRHATDAEAAALGPPTSPTVINVYAAPWYGNEIAAWNATFGVPGSAGLNHAISEIQEGWIVSDTFTSPVFTCYFPMQLYVDGVSRLDYASYGNRPGLIYSQTDSDNIATGGLTWSTNDNGRKGIIVNGADFAIPEQTDWYSAYSLSIPYTEFIKRYAYVQIWLNRFVDLSNSANLAKFFYIEGGIGKPVNPATAAAAFGTPDILMKGAHTTFVINGGGGGSFSPSGTISDFTPPPGR